MCIRDRFCTSSCFYRAEFIFLYGGKAMKEKIEAIRAAAKAAIEKTASENEIEELRVKYLGKKGELTALLKQMGSLSPEERPAMGQLVNEAKQRLEALITEKKAEMKQKATEAKLKAETIEDVYKRQAQYGVLWR